MERAMAKPNCPQCSSQENVVPILYGLVDFEDAQIKKDLETRKYVLGGCVVLKENWYCYRCEFSFSDPSIKSLPTKPKCPGCSSKLDVVPILYGYVPLGDEKDVVQEREKNREFILGGRVVQEEEWYCHRCESGFSDASVKSPYNYWR